MGAPERLPLVQPVVVVVAAVLRRGEAGVEVRVPQLPEQAYSGARDGCAGRAWGSASRAKGAALAD